MTDHFRTGNSDSFCELILLHSSCESSSIQIHWKSKSSVKFTHWMWHLEMVGDLLKRHNRKWPQVAGPLSEKRFACDNRSIFIQWQSQLLQKQHPYKLGPVISPLYNCPGLVRKKHLGDLDRVAPWWLHTSTPTPPQRSLKDNKRSGWVRSVSRVILGSEDIQGYPRHLWMCLTTSIAEILKYDTLQNTLKE